MYLNNVFEHCELHVQQIIQQQNHCINKLKKEKQFFFTDLDKVNDQHQKQYFEHNTLFYFASKNILFCTLKS